MALRSLSVVLFAALVGFGSLAGFGSLTGCHESSRPTPAPVVSASPGPIPAAPNASSPGAPASISPDPWATPATSPSDDPPTLVERHAHADAACPTVKAPYFFRIEKAGKTSHILGTRHISVPLAKFPQAVRDALGKAKLAVFEVAPDDESNLESPKLSLPDELGPDLWKHFQQIVGTSTAKALERATAAEAMITMIAMYEDIGAMLDIEIQRQAAAAKIPTAGLESSAFQDQLLEKLLDIKMLRAEVSNTKDRAELEQDSAKDLSEYCAGTDDQPGMDEDTKKDMLAAGYTAADIERIDEQMVYARNASWIPKLEKMFESGNVFVAVGADHLLGKRGVVSLLESRGFKVTRVPR